MVGGTPESRSRIKAAKHDARSRNLTTALELVSAQAATTRAEIARQTGLSRPAVSSLVSELIDQNLLREIGQGTSGGGKPPTLLALNERGRDIVALDLGHNPFLGALVDLTGRIHERIEADDVLSLPTGESAHRAAVEMIDALLAKATAPVVGIGIGAPGVVDPEGKIVEATNLDWHGLDFGRELRERFRLPVSIANDAAMAALAEFRRRPTDPNLILLKLGRGLGAGVILGGVSFRGAHSAAGEIGHVRVKEPGDPCRCGSTGCLETVASVPGMLRAMGADPEHPWDVVALTELLGEEQVRRGLSEASRYLGMALASVVATFDVSHLVLAPELLNASEILIDELGNELRSRVLPSTADLIEIEATELGGDLVLTGAASRVLVDHMGALLR